jgi:hypothetical protein
MTQLQTTVGYERFGLLSSPFSELDSESLGAVELCHVAQEVDRVLHGFKEQVIAKQSKASALLVGPLGVGKTERLRLAQCEAQRLSLTHAFVQVKPQADTVVRDVAARLLESAQVGAMNKFFNPPSWQKDLVRLSKKGLSASTPEAAGKIVIEAINAKAPSFLMFNDLQALAEPAELARFGDFAQTILLGAAPGLLFLATSYPEFVPRIQTQVPSLLARFYRLIPVQAIADAEAAQLVAKRLAVKRIVDDLDPIFPFDAESLHEINARSGNNPRELLKLADRVLDAAVQQRAYHVDADLTRTVLGGAAVPETVAHGGPIERAAPVPAPRSEPMVAARTEPALLGVNGSNGSSRAAAPDLTMAQRLRRARRADQPR